ncbi:MAG: hypothetical protein ACOVOR_01900 [Rhabdochlamydiaceae bacterium]
MSSPVISKDSAPSFFSQVSPSLPTNTTLTKIAVSAIVLGIASLWGHRKETHIFKAVPLLDSTVSQNGHKIGGSLLVLSIPALCYAIWGYKPQDADRSLVSNTPKEDPKVQLLGEGKSEDSSTIVEELDEKQNDVAASTSSDSQPSSSESNEPSTLYYILSFGWLRRFF